MKVALYTICLNESKHVKQFMDCAREADGIFITDTGSSDDTVKLLLEEGAKVQTIKVDPWRFDVARNASLDFVPEDFDVCISIDLDEVLTPGWCEAIKNVWSDIIDRLRYKYVWSHNSDGSDGMTFWYDKCHSRHGFKWIKPVHETLQFHEQERQGYCFNFTIHHYPDLTKSRSSYLPLLELGCKEDPNDDRSSHYLGREYLFREMYLEAINELKRHLELKTATWKAERASSMRFISQAYSKLNQYDDAIEWGLRSAAEAPGEREPWVSLAKIYFLHDDHAGCYFAIKNALAIIERPMTYICEPESWSDLPYDIGGISAYYLGMYKESFSLTAKAVEMNPTDARLRQNLQYAASMIR